MKQSFPLCLQRFRKSIATALYGALFSQHGQKQIGPLTCTLGWTTEVNNILRQHGFFTATSFLKFLLVRQFVQLTKAHLVLVGEDGHNIHSATLQCFSFSEDFQKAVIVDFFTSNEVNRLPGVRTTCTFLEHISHGLEGGSQQCQLRREVVPSHLQRQPTKLLTWSATLPHNIWHLQSCHLKFLDNLEELADIGRNSWRRHQLYRLR